MTFLTEVELNARRSSTRKFLSSPQTVHAAILTGFPSDRSPRRPLWRVDVDDPLRPKLYVVSDQRPDFTHIEEQAGWPSLPTTRTANYTGFLAELATGQRWAFRLRANPTHRVTSAGKTKVFAHVTVDQQIGWLLDREGSLGVGIGAEGEPTFTVVGRESLRFRRKQDSVTLGTATFEGHLVVTDPDKLRGVLTTGIGRAKAYGCGLMTLSRGA